MIRNSAIYPLVFVGLVLVTIGCGPPRRPTVKTAKVSGTVQFDGKPLDGAQVNFLGADYAGVATTDSAGHYELDAQPGENTIYVSKFEGVDPDFDETMVDTADMPGVGPKQMLPEKFSDPTASELRFTVPEEGSSEANFTLTAS